MKNIISRIMILAMLASFAACSSELDNAGGYAGDEAMVRMNFTGLNGFAVTRAVDQTAVEKVTVYLFEGTEESSELKYTLPVTLSDKTEAGLPGSFKVPEGGTYHVEAIANAETLTGISTYGDFLAQTTTAAFEGNLLMQSATAQDITLASGQTTTLSMELVRLAATFQVEGADEAGVSDVAFTLKGAVKESYLVKHADGDSFTIPANAETGESTVPYSYENPENSTVMVITGTMNGAAYRTEVPVAQVLRNHLYTVKLVNNSGTIEPELTVTDWSEISSSLEIGAGSALMMTAATDKAQEPEATVVYPEEGDLKSTQTVNVAADAAVTYYLYVKSANIEAALTHTTLPDGWTLAAPAETRADYLWEKGYWTLTIPANATSEERTLTVTATNKLIADATVSITFVQEGKEDEEVDHSKNPLLKWAKGDLVYDKGSQTSSIASSYQTQGSLYQWGRKYGFTDYKDAMGGYWATSQGRRRWYYAVQGTENQLNNDFILSATGSSNGFDDAPNYSYETNDEFANDELPIYFMNQNTGMTDYWLGDGGGSTWAERAEACGAKTANNVGDYVCPDGWRIPTKADFAEIKPTEALRGDDDLASVLNNRVELKKIEDVCSYAIRWSAETVSRKTYLRIDALVVPDSFQESELSGIDWENNENVVTRYFGANGFIHAFYHVNKGTVGGQYFTFPVARPMPGTETHKDVLKTYGYNYFTVTWDYITDYSVNNDGFYWVSDDKMAFTFNDNTRVKNVYFNNSYPFSSRVSLLGFSEVAAQDCCSIRCITDDPALQEK